jgi:hypothetical protein
VSGVGASAPGGLGRWAPAAVIVAGCAAIVGLHLFAPAFGPTWAYAHLARHAALPWIAVAVVVGLPAVGGWLWRRPAAAASVGPLRAPWAVGGAVAVVAAVVIAGFRWPVVPICIDSWGFARAVAAGTTQNPRWQLTLWTFGAIARWVHPWLASLSVVRLLNGVLVGIGLVALAGAARLLGRTVRDAVAMTAVAWTAFGTAQLALGYVDVYPIALAIVALHLWAGAAALAGRRSAAWAVAAAAVGPFFYVGLVLLVPSACVVAWYGGPEETRLRRLAGCAAVGLVLAGVATMPVEGSPFAWWAFLRAMASPAGNPGSVFGRGWPGLSPGEIATRSHLVGVGNVLLLIDPVGALLLAACGISAAAVAPRPIVWWSVAVLAPQVAYLFVMDPLFGHFADWDLYSYLAASTSLFGGLAFVTWARRAPRWSGVLLGAALAAAVVHLLARLDALDVAFAAHLVETPFRITIPGH